MASTSEGFDPYFEWLGIQPHERPADHYRLLGINRFETDRRVISNAADQRMLFLKTFQTGPNAEISQTLLNELSAARLCLLNPKKKARYDKSLRGDTHERAVAPHVETAPLAIPVVPDASPDPASFPNINVNASPPVSVSPETSTIAQRRQSNEGEGRVRSIVSRGWLPLIAVIGTIAVAGIVWAIGNTLMHHQPVLDETVKERNRQIPPSIGSPKQQTSIESQPADTVTVYQEGNGSIHLTASVATIRGASPRKNFTSGEAVIDGWTSISDWLEWKFLVINPGMFRILVSYQADQTTTGGIYELSVGDQTAQKMVSAMSDESADVRTDECQLEVPRKGAHQLRMRAVEIPGKQFVILRSIQMIPIQP